LTSTFALALTNLVEVDVAVRGRRGDSIVDLDLGHPAGTSSNAM